jgi:hypothetical protein
MIFVSKLEIKISFIFFNQSNFLPAPTRAVTVQTVPAVGERLIKSKIIPDQARALAHALKHAVVKPLKKTMMTKKKSLDTNSNEQIITHSLSNPSPIIIENSDNLLTETSVDSFESTSPIALTPPPAKPPRHNDEADSSSSTEINSPPAKPPRHFSLYSTDNDEGLIQQTDNVVKKVLNLVDTFGIISANDNDMNILRQTSPPPIYIQQPSNSIELEEQSSEDLQTPEIFTVDPARITLNTDSQLITKTIDEPLTIISSSSFPISLNDLSFSPINESIESDNNNNNNSTPFEITQLATNLTENIFQEVEKEFEKQDKLTNLNTIINNDRQNLLEKLSTNNTFRDNAPTLPQSVATTHPSPIQSTSRPLMFVSLDSGFNVTKAFSPLLDIVTTKSTPKITTSVTVISPPQPELSSTITTTNINSDDEEQLNSTSTLVPNSSIASDRSKFLQTSSKESSIDSNDTNPFDNTTLQQQQNTGSATPARSLLSDYDNLHGSYGSLNDDTQQLQSLPPPPAPSSTSSETTPSIPTTNASSVSTIYESLDTIPSSSSSTSTYVTARSTLNNDNTSGSETATKRINSDISDEDLVESYDIETPILTSVNPFRSSKGRIASHHIQINKHEYIYSHFWHVLTSLVFFSPLFGSA